MRLADVHGRRRRRAFLHPRNLGCSVSRGPLRVLHEVMQAWAETGEGAQLARASESFT